MVGESDGDQVELKKRDLKKYWMGIVGQEGGKTWRK